MNPPAFREFSADREGEPLVDFLARVIGLSKNKAKDLVDTRGVFVNERRVWMARHPLRKGSRVRAPAAIAAPSAAPVALRRLLEDAELLVVDKPAGRVSNDRKGSVEDLLAAEGRRWIPVHRLDADTTGCLLFAATPEAKAALVEQFKAQTVGKTYEAVVVGEVDRPEFILRAPLDGLPAVSHVRRIAGNDRASLVSVEIETGRTHQIRRHLAGIGHPLVGEKQYAGGARVAADLQACPRQLLHAREIRFAHPRDGRPIRVTAPRPADFMAWVRRLGLEPGAGRKRG